MSQTKNRKKYNQALVVRCLDVVVAKMDELAEIIDWTQQDELYILWDAFSRRFTIPQTGENSFDVRRILPVICATYSIEICLYVELIDHETMIAVVFSESDYGPMVFNIIRDSEGVAVDFECCPGSDDLFYSDDLVNPLQGVYEVTEEQKDLFRKMQGPRITCCSKAYPYTNPTGKSVV